MMTNFVGPALLMGALAERFEHRGSGGPRRRQLGRGRPVNYVYGSAKAGFTVFLSGLRNRLGKSGVHVVTAEPGQPGYVAIVVTSWASIFRSSGGPCERNLHRRSEHNLQQGWGSDRSYTRDRVMYSPEVWGVRHVTERIM